MIGDIISLSFARLAYEAAQRGEHKRATRLMNHAYNWVRLYIQKAEDSDRLSEFVFSTWEVLDDYQRKIDSLMEEPA